MKVRFCPFAPLVVGTCGRRLRLRSACLGFNIRLPLISVEVADETQMTTRTGLGTCTQFLQLMQIIRSCPI